MKKWKCRVVVKVMTAIALLGGILYFWICVAEAEVHYTPDYPEEDIIPYLEKEALTEEEYHILYRQTGLSRIAVDTLQKENRIENEVENRKQNRIEEIMLALQKRFFAEVEIDCECDSLIFREVLKTQDTELQLSDTNTAIMPVLENGDILITFNTHFLGWRNGHAAIVVDAEKGLTLEALTLGRDSAVLSLKSWAARPSFAVLRLAEASKEQRAEIAAYAEEALVQLPYHLTAGIGGGEISGTQCAHLVWCAYQKFGYDLDSDGGWIVTPKDLYESPLLEVIQLYGMKPEEKQ